MRDAADPCSLFMLAAIVLRRVGQGPVCWRGWLA